MSPRKRQLPIQLQPPITSYPEHAYLLSVLAVSDDYLPWFFSNFIQLMAVKAPQDSRYWFDFYVPCRDHALEVNPCIHLQKWNRDSLDAYKLDIIDLLMDSIDLGYYIYLYVNEYYIPGSPAYLIKDLSHGNMIFGYNMEDRTFQMAGFLKNLKFTSIEVDFETLEKAFKDNPTIEDFELKMYLFKRREKVNFEFDLQHVVMLLEEYLASANSSERERTFQNPLYKQPLEGHFGKEVYVCMKKDLQDECERDGTLLVRPMHILWEHKNSMLLRLRYLEQNRDVRLRPGLVERYEKLERSMLLLRNSVIKYYLVRNKSILIQVMDGLDRICLEETQILEALLDDLKGGQ